MNGVVCLESRGTVIRVPVRIVSASARSAELRGLDEIGLPWRAAVTLVVEDERGALELPAEVARHGSVTTLRLRSVGTPRLRWARLVRERFEATREVSTEPERPSALRRRTGPR